MGVHGTPASIPIPMPAKRCIVTLTEKERTQLQALIHKGREHAFRRRRAQILLQVDAGGGGPSQGYFLGGNRWVRADRADPPRAWPGQARGGPLSAAV